MKDNSRKLTLNKSTIAKLNTTMIKTFNYFFILVVLFLNSHLLLSQNEYLKYDSSIYCIGIDKMPKVKSDWKSFIIENSVPLKSIESDSFADLQFLKTLLSDKQYVFLGESSHTCEEYSKMKYRLIRFLSQEMGFEVIAFESNMWDCHNINMQKNDLDTKQMLINSIYGVWHTTTLLDMMDYIKRKNLTLAGFDIKESGLPDYLYEKNTLSKMNSSLASEAINTLEDYYAYKKYLGQNNYFHKERKIEPRFYTWGNEIITSLTMLRDSLIELIKMHPHDIDLQVYCKDIENKTTYTGFLVAENGSSIALSEKRDSLMAATFTWLVQKVFPDKKIIIWAHNAHIAACNVQYVKRMGAWLSDTIKQKSYTIGLYMHRGTVYYKKMGKVRKPYKNSLEAIMIQPAYKYAFLDFAERTKTEGNSWLFNKTPTTYWGTSKENLVLKDAYDGIILIDSVSSPNYLFDFMED